MCNREGCDVSVRPSSAVSAAERTSHLRMVRPAARATGTATSGTALRRGKTYARLVVEELAVMVIWAALFWWAGFYFGAR